MAYFCVFHSVNRNYCSIVVKMTFLKKISFTISIKWNIEYWKWYKNVIWYIFSHVYLSENIEDVTAQTEVYIPQVHQKLAIMFKVKDVSLNLYRKMFLWCYKITYLIIQHVHMGIKTYNFIFRILQTSVSGIHIYRM